MDKKTILLTLKYIEGIGNITSKKILDIIDKDEISFEELYGIIKNNNRTKNLSLDSIKIAYNKTVGLLNKLNGDFIEIITYLDEKYPKCLLDIKDVPTILFYSGNIELLSKKCVAIIGTRAPSEKGKIISYELSQRLCKDNVIVSGLAEGVDFQAHLAAVKNDGKTIAVIGQGINNIMKTEKNYLAKEIIDKNGLIITEYLPEEPPTKYTYVKRDRIQSAISDKVFVIESERDGGTMHTVKFAKEQNKELLVFKSKNTNYKLPSGNSQLIGEGAKIFDEDFTIK